MMRMTGGLRAIAVVVSLVALVVGCAEGVQSPSAGSVASAPSPVVTPILPATPTPSPTPDPQVGVYVAHLTTSAGIMFGLLDGLGAATDAYDLAAIAEGGARLAEWAEAEEAWLAGNEPPDCLRTILPLYEDAVASHRVAGLLFATGDASVISAAGDSVGDAGSAMHEFIEGLEGLIASCGPVVLPAAPASTPKPTATPKPTPVPAVLSKKGRGDKVLKFTAQDAPTIAKITNKGTSNFAVTSYAGTSYDDLLVNEIGRYSGTVYINPGADRLKVNSNGSWSVTIRSVSSAKPWDGASAISGKGDSVVMLSGGSFGTTTIKNKGRSNFAVIAYSPDGEYLDLLVNEIGSYKGEVLLPSADPVVLSIKAVGGSWSFSVVE